MSKYFKDAAGLAAFLSFVVAVVVIVAIIVGGFAVAMLGLFIVFAPICVVALAPIRRYVSRNHDFLESLLSKVEGKEEELRAKVRAKRGASA